VRARTSFNRAAKSAESRCLACARVPLHFLGHESHSMQQQGVEQQSESIGSIGLFKNITSFSTIFSTIFYQ